MSDISPIGRPSAAAFNATQAYQRAAQPQTVERPADQVQVSDTARMLSKLQDMPEVRQDLVESIRTQIADGTYETPDKIDALLDELLSDLQ